MKKKFTRVKTILPGHLKEEAIAEQLTAPEEEFIPTPLQSSAIQRVKKKMEIVSLLKAKELESELKIAVDYVYKFSADFLSSADREQVFLDFKRISSYLESANKLDLETINSFSDKLGISPITLESLESLIVGNYETGDYRSAAALAALLTILLMNSPRPWLLRGLCCLKLKQYDKSFSSFITVILLMPEQPYAYLCLAQTLEAQGDREMALNALHFGQDRLAEIKEESEEWRSYAQELAQILT